MIWMHNFKIAIIEENIQQIEALINEIPDLDTKNDAKEALHLIKEATRIVNLQKQKTLESMHKIKQTKAFLNH